MTTEFDPYRKWLGIPQAELPPNHYRLLGIANFEDDPDVIENAADRSMAHIQTFKTGKHGQLTQKLLNELSAAKLCLLEPEKKLVYDANLRNQMSASAAEPLPVATTVVPQAQPFNPSQPLASAPQPVPDTAAIAQDVSTAPQPVFVASKPGSVSKRGMKKRKKDIVLYVVSLGIALLLVAGAIVVLGPSNNPKDGKPNSETAESNSAGAGQDTHLPGAIANKKNGKPNPSDVDKPDEKSPVDEFPKTSDPGNTVEVPNPTNDIPIAPVEPGNGEAKKLTLHWKMSPFSKRANLDSLTLEEESGFGNFDTDSLVEASEKPPLPNNADHEESLSEVREAFPIDSTDTPDKKLALARKMYGLALKEADGAARYALLTAAHELALTSSHVKSSMRIADAVRMLFETGDNEFHPDLLDRAAARSSKDAADSVATATLLLVERSVQAGEFELAQRLLDQAKSRAKDAANPLLTQTAEAIADELPALEAQYREAQSAVATLEQTPDDPQASERVGRFMCFVLGDWDHGLRLLSHANDPEIRAAAENDLTFPLRSDERVKAGDLWWDLSEKSADSIKLALRDRAAYWYERTADQLTGVTKERIAKRLNIIREEVESEALADLPSSARELVGQYFVKYVNQKTGQTTFLIWELRDDLTATENGAAIARWKATDPAGFKLMFLDSPETPVYLRFRGPKVPLTGVRTFNGVSWSLAFERLSVVAVWEHKTDSYTNRLNQVTPASSESLTFYSNGRVNDPLGQIVWLVQGRNLAIDWGKGKKTAAMLSPDGTTYTGKTMGIGRPTNSADVNGRRITISE